MVKVARGLFIVMSAALLSLQMGTSPAHAADLKKVKEWTGEVDDIKLEKEWPNASPITNKEDFAKVWKSWNPKQDVPEIDFTKELVLVSSQKIGKIYDLVLVDRGGGTYISTGSIERKQLKGFTFAFTVFKKASVKTINGKPLK